MAYTSVNLMLDNSLAEGGALSIPYPPGKSEGTFFTAMNHNATVAANFYRCPRDFLIDFQADRIIFTWRGNFSLPAGTLINLQLEEPCGEFYRDLKNGITVLNMVHSQMFLVNLTSPSAPDPQYYVKSQAVTSTKTLALVNQWSTVARNVEIHSRENSAHCTFTIEGEDMYGRTIIESITGSGAAGGVAEGKKAFARVSRITPSQACNGEISIGTGRKLGLPVFLPGPAFVMREIANGKTIEGGVIVPGETVMVASATTGDRRGTYTPPTATELNGRNFIQLLLSLPNPGNIGSMDYAG